MLVAQSCLTLCNPMDDSLPGSSVHGILQARILQQVVIPFSRKEHYMGNIMAISAQRQTSWKGGEKGERPRSLGIWSTWMIPHTWILRNIYILEWG